MGTCAKWRGRGTRSLVLIKTAPCFMQPLQERKSHTSIRWACIFTNLYRTKNCCWIVIKDQFGPTENVLGKKGDCAPEKK